MSASLTAARFGFPATKPKLIREEHSLSDVPHRFNGFTSFFKEDWKYKKEKDTEAAFFLRRASIRLLNRKKYALILFFF